MKIVLLHQAADDLDEIIDPLYSDIIHKLEVLKSYPMLGVAMTGPFAGYRSLAVDFFRIVYRIQNKDTIEIAYIRDCRRKPLD